MGAPETDADLLKDAVWRFVGAIEPRNVVCPREQSELTPCIGRDGRTALADDMLCVGCGHGPTDLLAEHRKRHP